MSIEADLRHATNNEAAKQAAIDALGPTVKNCMYLIFEMDEEEFREWRDYVKKQQAGRMRNKKTLWELVAETLKWIVFSGLTAALTYYTTHWNSKP